jgi:hypothetical protein
MSKVPVPLLPASVKKPVSTLAMVPKTGRITTMGRRLWNVLLGKAQEQGVGLEEYRAPLRDILKGIDFNSNNQALVKEHLAAMVSTAVEWQSPTEGEGPDWNVCGMLAHARIYKQRGEVWVEWSYAVNMRHELLDPERFARLSLDVISQLTSHPASALYEIGTRYKDVGQTARKPVHWWMPVLIGKPFDERMQKLEYRIFKRDVIRPGTAQVNAQSDIDVEMKEFKTGRFVTELQLLVKKKPQRSLDLQQKVEPLDMSMYAKAQSLGIDNVRAEHLSDEFGESALSAGLDGLEKRIATAFPEPVRDPYRYLKSLMPAHAAAQVQEREVAVAARAPEAIEAASAELKGVWAQKWIAARMEEMVAEILALSKERQAELCAALAEELSRKGEHPTYRQSLETRGWRHPIVRRKMVEFYATGAYGSDWGKPTPEQLLDVAAKTTQAQSP